VLVVRGASASDTPRTRERSDSRDSRAFPTVLRLAAGDVPSDPIGKGRKNVALEQASDKSGG